MWDSITEFLFGPHLGENNPNISAEWVTLSDWALWQEFTVIAVAIIVLAVTAWNLRHAHGRLAKAVLFFLRACTLSILLFAFYQPALLETEKARSTNTVLMLVDDSSSMALPHTDMTRRDLVAQFIRQHEALWKTVEESNVLESFRFADKLQPTEWRQMDSALTAAGNHTHITESLEELRDLYRNRDIGGIVILSDGIDNGRAGRVTRQTGALDRDTERLLKSFEAPIYTFGIQGAPVKDIGVHTLRYSPFAFKRNRASIEADIRVHGYQKGELAVELVEEGRLVRSVTHQVKPGKTRYTATFEFTPNELGQRVYSIRVKPFPNEVTNANNQRHAVIRVGRDKVRVLQIAGHPSWDVRFLRNHLKRTPNIQLISFFILINTGSTLSVFDNRETSLIPFPAEELFINELGGFDLVIFQDFNYGPFSTPQHLHRVRDYVKNGGALLMVGGRLSLGAGNYEGTELTEVLPVKMKVPDALDDALDTRFFRPKLTKAGLTHSIMQLSSDTSQNKDAWAKLPLMEGINKTLGLLNDGIALARHPKLKDATGLGMPVVAVNEPQKGRVAVVATDSMWRLKLPNVGKGGNDRHYDRFINNLTRWLIKDPDLDLLRVTTSAGVVPLGEPIALDIRVLTPEYAAAQRHDIELVVQQRGVDGADSHTVYESGPVQTDTNGRWSTRRVYEKSGIYDVTAKSMIGGRLKIARAVFVISDERPEMREVRGNEQLLQALSLSTGGASYALTHPNPELKFNPPRVSEVTSRKYHEQWNIPAVFLLACLLFSLEWWLRRRWGFL